jgi:Uncharacterized protein domain (DUF2202).
MLTFEDMPIGEYDIPKDTRDFMIHSMQKGVASKQAALEVGCMVEVVDVDDLDRYIEQAKASNATDIVDAFSDVLRQGSYNHYWAFDKGLKNNGYSSRLCSSW